LPLLVSSRYSCPLAESLQIVRCETTPREERRGCSCVRSIPCRMGRVGLEPTTEGLRGTSYRLLRHVQGGAQLRDGGGARRAGLTVISESRMTQ
jgi:hypothetical protein